MAKLKLNISAVLDLFNPEITIKPTNGVVKGSEDGTLTGTISVQDPSLLGTGLLNSGVKVTVSAGKNGTLVLGPDTDSSNSGFVGKYTYTPKQSTREGVVLSDSFTITAIDGAGRSVERTFSLSYTGVNDQPVLTALSVQPKPVFEATTGLTKLPSALTGNFSVKDVDVGDTLTASVAKMTVALQGGTVSSALQKALTDGFKLSGPLTANGNNQTISYTYAKRDLDLNFLAKDQNLTVTFDVVVTDNSKATTAKSATQSVTFTFVGTNDAPTLATPKVITLVDTAADDNFAASPASKNLTGTLVGKDVDLNDTLAYGIEGEVAVDGIATKVGKFGVLTVNTKTGQYEYKANDAAVEALTANNAEAFVVTVSDGIATAKANLKVNITATNDKPVLQVIEAIEFVDTAADDVFSAVTGSVTAIDPDGPVTYTIEGGKNDKGFSVKNGQYGTLSLNTQNGEYTFVPNDAAIEAQVQRVVEDFKITAFDGKLKDTKNLTIVVKGANDTAEFGGDLTAALTEDAVNNKFEGKVTVADRDLNQNGFKAAQNLEGTYGTFTFNNTTGEWTYTLDNARQATNALAKDAMATDTLTITSTGGTTQNLVVNITGANDAPTVTAGPVYTESGITFTVTDPDTGAVLSLDKPRDTFFDGVNVANAAATALTVLAQNAPAADALVVKDEHGATVEVGYVALGTDGIDGVADIDADTGFFALAKPGAAYGFGGDDGIIGSTGNDSIFGGAGNDLIFSASNSVSTGSGSDLFSGGEGDDTLVADDKVDTLLGGAGDDTVEQLDLAVTGADQINLADSDAMTGDVAATESLNDTVFVTSTAQTRISFISGQVGNSNVNSTGAAANAGTAYAGEATGGLAVRLQNEDAAGNLIGDIARADDEGISFVAVAGGTFDVRDFQTGAQRGNDFDVVTLGTSRGDVIDETGETANYYINAGRGDDMVTGGEGNDFLVGGAGNDVLNGGNGNDTLLAGDGVDFLTPGLGSDVVDSSAAITANADIIYGFVSGTDNFDYNGFSGASLVGPVNAVSSTTFTDMLKVANTNVEVFIRTATNLGDNSNASDALNDLAAATSAADVVSRYEAFEAELLSNTGVLNASNATFNNALATVVGQGESLLLVLTNGSHSVALRYNNIDGNATTAAKVVTAAELELVGVFNGTAQLAAADFI